MVGPAAIGPRITGVARKVPSWTVYGLGAVPGLWLLWNTIVIGAYVDPVRALEQQFGLLALQFLLGSLTITPLLRFVRVNLLKFRKALGLVGFAYLVLHFTTWLALDLQLRWSLVGGELVKRPYLTIGFLSLLLLIPLAVTSWQGAIRRMGARDWARLHRIVYAALLLGVVHFIMQEKVWTPESLFYLGAAVILIGMRLVWIR